MSVCVFIRLTGRGGRMGSTTSLPVSGRAERQESWDMLKQPSLQPCSTSRWDDTQNLVQVQWEDCTTKKPCFVVWVCGLRSSRAMWGSLRACNPPGTQSEAVKHKKAGRIWGTPRLKGPPGPPSSQGLFFFFCIWSYTTVQNIGVRN